MAKRPDDREPAVLPIADEFSELSDEEQVEATAEWLATLAQREPVELPISSAELVAQARAESGW